MTSGDRYNFTANATMFTPSGTPEAENFTEQEVQIGGKQLTAWKELIGEPSNPTTINSTIWIEVVSDSPTSTIDGIKFIDYLSAGTDMSDGTCSHYTGNVTLYTHNGTGDFYWEHGVNFSIVCIPGTVTLPDGTEAYAFEYNTSDGSGWSLGNAEYLNVTYKMNVTTSGAYVLPTIISGFDPATGDEFTTVAIGSIYVNIPEPLLPLEIDEDEFKQAKMAFVNKPVLWMKDFNVYNPNGKTAKSRFTLNVFSDAQEGYVSYYDEYGKRIE
jgi:hypothetical protein